MNMMRHTALALAGLAVVLGPALPAQDRPTDAARVRLPFELKVGQTFEFQLQWQKVPVVPSPKPDAPKEIRERAPAAPVTGGEGVESCRLVLTVKEAAPAGGGRFEVEARTTSPEPAGPAAGKWNLQAGAKGEILSLERVSGEADAGKSWTSEGDLRCRLAAVLGSGLHDRDLVPGESYTVDSGAKDVARPDGPVLERQVKLRFETVESDGALKVARFVVDPGTKDLTGQASYRTENGLLQNLALNRKSEKWMSISRVQGEAPKDR